MEFLFVLLLLPMPVYVDLATNVPPALVQPTRESRTIECTRISQEEAHDRYPGKIPAPPARAIASQGVNEALLCARWILEPGQREARDEAILSTLTKSVAEISEAASALNDAGVTWHVESFYPDPQVASKIAVAAKTHLAEHGHSVSDRVPILAAGDIIVLGAMPPPEAYRTACTRYFAEGSLGPNDALLGIALIDARETQLHAGICRNGEWKWLR